MKFIYLKGWTDVASYEAQCRKNGLDPADRKVVFLFPGNSGHHGTNATLFSIKSGGGLASAANAIGQKGYPVLSLPTTTMEDWVNNAKQKATVQQAIEDLYRALGAGYSLMLPVRLHNNKKYFDEGLDKKLDKDKLIEPNFWGGIQVAANILLANHYTSELNKLITFMALSHQEKLQNATQADANNPLYQAWLKGHNMRKDDAWLKPVVAITSKKTDSPEVAKQEASIKKPAPLTAPASYHTFFTSKNDPLANARALLNDYTKSNSALSRFFHGHWNRHHVQEISKIVSEIDNNTLQNIDDLMKKLKSIKLANPIGSLAKRIRFIEEKTPPVVIDNDDAKTMPGQTL